MADAPLWTAEELVAATGGELEGSVSARLGGVSIDSRTLAPGDIFVAIRGERHDGHDFAAPAIRAGAGVAIVSKPTAEMRQAGPILVVKDDPLDALVRMGNAARQRSHARIIGVTGSVGKTSTKEILREALSASGLTHASASSFNNHWGVPLSLARLPREAAYAVFEIGMNHPGEITPLTRMVRPHIAIVTAIAASHLGHFSSLDGIADAKAEIFTGVVPGGTAIINRDTPYFERLAAAARAAGIGRIEGFGRSAAATARLERIVVHPDCCCVTADVLGENVIYRLGVPGEHMGLNSIAVLAAVKIAGADLARGALALAAAKPAKGRGVRHLLRIDRGTLVLIDESYNANPASVRAALKLLAATPTAKGGRRIAVLGDMLELGASGPALHAELAVAVDEAGIDTVYACGPLMAHLWDKLPQSRRGAHADSSDGIRSALISSLRPGDAVMVKGSLGSRMGPIVEAITARYPPEDRNS
jgi:UDP-N-acetylmuramoyl-tripeptide--D-alanyl-D-alanine ligase